MSNGNKLLLGLTAFAFLLYSPFPYAAEEETLNPLTAQAISENDEATLELTDVPHLVQTPEPTCESTEAIPEEGDSPAAPESTDAADVFTPEATIVPNEPPELSPTETAPVDEELPMEAILPENTDESNQTGSIIVHIPSTIAITRESAQGHGFDISVSGFDTLSAAMMLEICVSSQNGFSLAGEDGSIAYELRCGTNGTALENGGVLACFSADGAQQMVLSVAGEFPQSGRYADRLTFTFRTIRSENEDA